MGLPSQDRQVQRIERKSFQLQKCAVIQARERRIRNFVGKSVRTGAVSLAELEKVISQKEGIGVKLSYGRQEQHCYFSFKRRVWDSEHNSFRSRYKACRIGISGQVLEEQISFYNQLSRGVDPNEIISNHPYKSRLKAEMNYEETIQRYPEHKRELLALRQMSLYEFEDARNEKLFARKLCLFTIARFFKAFNRYGLKPLKQVYLCRTDKWDDAYIRSWMVFLVQRFKEPASKDLFCKIKDLVDFIKNGWMYRTEEFLKERQRVMKIAASAFGQICQTFERVHARGDATCHEKNKFLSLALEIISMMAKFGYDLTDFRHRQQIEIDIPRFIEVVKLLNYALFHLPQFIDKFDLIPIFVRAGANINAKNENGLTALEHTFFQNFGKPFIPKTSQDGRRLPRKVWPAVRAFLENGARLFVSQNDVPLLKRLRWKEKHLRVDPIPFNSFITLKDMAARAVEKHFSQEFINEILPADLLFYLDISLPVCITLTD
ncbi:unnamed protein product [Caenorhabditis auriculariae]|uniref:Uncharacterized protein n=1 Tax=Caenorhabditis auriculariae TaxID=2777116 RepID=A0A8S1H289_9PELO|nr:unnamed protein product [Caenorhabditis auriculariae]